MNSFNKEIHCTPGKIQPKRYKQSSIFPILLLLLSISSVGIGLPYTSARTGDFMTLAHKKFVIRNNTNSSDLEAVLSPMVTGVATMVIPLGLCSLGSGICNNTVSSPFIPYTPVSIPNVTAAININPIQTAVSSASLANSIAASESFSSFDNISFTAYNTPSTLAASTTPTATNGVSLSLPTVTASSGKRGLSYNVASLTDAFAGSGMRWAYNWAASPNGTILPGLEYVPMLWGTDYISGWASAASSAIESGSTHLLSFNEPDISTQSNLPPSEAASLHIANMNQFSSQAQIGSPAVSNGVGSSPPMGITWLQQFFDACAGDCEVDFIAFHYYNDASQLDDFKSHVTDVVSIALENRISNVWLTEFGATGSDAAVASFLSEALTFLDNNNSIERYAYFMCGDGTLLNGSSLSTIGQIYAS
jgi:Glycosyl hydrolase catalytic core